MIYYSLLLRKVNFLEISMGVTLFPRLTIVENEGVQRIITIIPFAGAGGKIMRLKKERSEQILCQSCCQWLLPQRCRL